MSRLNDTSTVGKVNLANTDPASGAQVANTQKAINKAFEGVGATGESDANVNNYASNNYIVDGTSRKAAVEALDVQLGATQTQLAALDAINSQDVTVSAIGSTPNANGATLTGQILSLEPASASFGGVVTTGAQTLSGNKTFSNNIIISGNQTTTGTATFNGNVTFNSPITFPAGTTGINSTNLEVTDKNIFVNVGGNDASSEGAGLTVDRTGVDGSMIYRDTSATKWAAGAFGSEVDLVGTTSTQTLTNKTLTSPVISSPTGITSANVGLGNVTNDAQLKRAANDFSTFTEKTTLVADDLFLIEDSEAAGVKKKVKRSNVGSGSGSGGSAGKNFVTNPDADTGTTGWFGDSFSAAARPSSALLGVGTGVTFTTTTSGPLDGVNSFLFSKDAVNRQGRVVYTNLIITPAYFAKVLQISADYLVSSGTFVAGTSTADSDVIFYLQNVTDGTFIEPSSFKLLSNSTTISDKFQATFQTAAAATSYRLLIYVASTSAAAYSLKFDNIAVSPSTYVYGTPVTDWQVFTPTGSWVTNVNYSGKKRRVGDTYEYDVLVALTGAPTAAGLTVNIPETIDATKINSTSTSVQQLGVASILDSGVVHYDLGSILYNGPNSVTVRYNAGGTPSSTLGVTNTGPFTFGNNDSISLIFRVPVVGASSSVQTSDQTDTRVVSFAIASATPTATITSSFSLVRFTNTPSIDTHGRYNPATGLYTILVPGPCRVSGGIGISGTYSTNALAGVSIFKNGVEAQTGYHIAGGAISQAFANVTTLQDLKVGDTIGLYAISTATGPTVNANVNVNYLTLDRISGPSAIAASESVNAVYTTAAGQSIPNGAFTIINFGTREEDSNGFVTTGAAWKFQPNIGGVFDISVLNVFSASGGWISGESAEMWVYKNSSQFASLDWNFQQATHSNRVQVKGTRLIRLLAQDFIDIRIFQDSGAALTLVPTAAYNHISIKRVGN